MKERPILFSGQMVKALLEDRKTQTRRLVKPEPGSNINAVQLEDGRFQWHSVESRRECPYGKPGDHLWVRETFMPMPHLRAKAFYRASDPLVGGKWKPSIFMPRALSRITLEITSVGVERLQDIGRDGHKAADVLAEGITDEQIEHWRKWLHPDDAPAHTYGVLWDSINGKGSWAKNPWAWKIEFKPVAKPD